MGIEKCIQEVIDAAGGSLTKEHAKDLLEHFRTATEQMRLKDKFATMDQILTRVKQEFTDRSQIAILHERSTMMRQQLIADQYSVKFNGVDKTQPNAVLKAFNEEFRRLESIVETTRREPNWWLSVQLDNHPEAVAAFKTPTMFAEAVDRFFEPRSSRNLQGVSPEVSALLQVFDSTNDFIYSAANKVGGYLNWKPTTLFSGKVGLAEHVGKLDKDVFVERVLDLMADDMDTLNKHGIFKHADIEERLGKVYDFITRGENSDVHGAYSDELQPLVEKYYGKSINALSDSLFDLPFKDGAAYRQYFQEFNGGDLSEHFMGNLRQTGRNLALVKAFGPVPKLGFEKMVKAAKGAAATESEGLRIEGKFVEGISKEENRWVRFGKVGDLMSGVEKLGKMGKDWLTSPNPEHWYKTLAGETDMVHDQSMANLGRSVRGYTALSKLLGFGHVTQWGDLPTSLALMGQISDNPLATFGATLDGYMKAYDPNVKLDMHALKALSASMDVMHGNMLDMYFSAGENGVERANMFDKLFKYTGMSRLDWVRIKATNEYLNSHMASALEGTWADIRPELRAMMEKADIVEADWEHLKVGIRKVDALGGADHLLPEYIKDADIRSKYLRMQNEAARIAIPRPGAMEAALINRGTNPGTTTGEILRTIGLFKSFGLATATRVLPFVNENLGIRQRMAWGVGMVTTAMMRDAVKQMMLGKTPRQYDWTDAKTYAELFTFSGMGGVYGDMIMSDMSKFGPVGGVAGALAGPLFTGPVQSTVDLGHAMFSDKTPGEKTQKAVQTGLRLTGADNLPVASGIMNRVMIYNLYNALNPEWMQNHLNGLKSRGQTEF